MNLRLSSGLLAVLIIGLLAGCATTAQTDADKVSGGDLLFGRERLQGFLESRRQVLAALQSRAGELEGRMWIAAAEPALRLHRWIGGWRGDRCWLHR